MHSSPLPRQVRIRQRLANHALGDAAATLVQRLARVGDDGWQGRRVAVALGSRGIDQIAAVAGTLITWLRERGAEPFVIPAMGSHGGATPAGQRELLASYGITTEALGVPVDAEMDTDDVGRTASGVPVRLSRVARDADALVLVNRIKPHTDFESLTLGSGLLKMAAIGLGKIDGASACHEGASRLGYETTISEVAAAVLACLPRVYGVGLVEDGTHRLARVAVLRAAEIAREEPALLHQARAWMPALPFPDVDVLIVDTIGKNISGAGMDTNVIGRKFNDHKAMDDEHPKVKRILVRGLTEETHGNAAGIGIAEFCTRKVIDQIDLRITKINCLTGGHPTAAMLPVYYDSERETLDQALTTIGLTQPHQARILWIRDTLHLAEVECSDAYWKQAQQRSDLEILTELRDLTFDSDDNLASFESALAH